MVKTENTRVNIKARIDRHLRIVRNNDGKNPSSAVINKPAGNYHIIVVLFFIVLVFPIYPTLASFVYSNSNYDFYRGDIDESSIIESYYGGDFDESDFDLPLFESTNSFISVNTILNDSRNLVGTNEIVAYEVVNGDSFSKIANDFGVSINSILWANDFSKNKTLRPGEVIRIPPVSGLIHKVVSGDTLGGLAIKYDIGESKIREQNGLTDYDTLKIGDSVIIPGAIKKEVKPVYVAPPTPTRLIAKPTSAPVIPSTSQIVSNQGTFKLTWRQPQHTFYWGNCTRYVAQYKNVNWGGNANQWLANARSKGHQTGMAPRLGSIVSFSGTGYNPRYGHVGIVTEVRADHIIVSDMNYRKINEVTYRKVSINDRSINGYIYVD